MVSTLPTHARRAACFLAVAATLALTAFAAYTLSRPASPTLDRFFNDGVYNAIQLMAVAGCCLRLAYVRADRVPWALITAGLASWSVADLLFSFAYDNEPPYPSAADGFYLPFYPLCYVGLLLLIRQHIADFRRSLWLDGLTAALGAAALGAAVLVELVLETTEGSPSVVVTNLLYPLGDVLLLSVVFGAFAVGGWRPGSAWLFVGLGFFCQIMADAAFLFQAASETYVPGAPFDMLWPLGMLLLAWASWQVAAPGVQRQEARPWMATPAVASLSATAILVYDHYRRLNLLALALAVATLVIVLLRLRMTFRENERILAQIRALAITDALTELGNRRSLVDDLDRALAAGAASPPRLLVIYDLDGFKRYNDTFGHPAGDVLLHRFGRKLADVTATRGIAYRLGGDEFCILCDSPGDPDELLDLTVAALSDEGDGFSVTTSFGAVSIPKEAADASEALRLADQRLYAQKHSSELARNRPHEALLQAISEREPELLAHSRNVAVLSLEVAARLELSWEEWSVLRVAAELHDVGKLAIPDSILLKTEPLTRDEWDFIRRHTEVGQRILTATPALHHVGRIVRASHERWDGRGYPDGLRGERIPLAARIIAVCDAFTAMTSERPYGVRMTTNQALAELTRCAGRQFDPGVVAAFAKVVAAGGLETGPEAGVSVKYSPSALALRVATRAS
jgi:two-component system, cell cycle response regulator